MKAHTKPKTVINRDATNGRNFLDTDPYRKERVVAQSQQHQAAKAERRQAMYDKSR